MCRSSIGRESLSLVLPVLNESREIRRFLAMLHREPPDELIIVDGGSEDDTIGIARRAVTGLQQKVRVRFHREDGGLASQINRGAADSVGRYLFFPYVDCRLPDGWRDRIYAALADPGTVGGAFRLGFDADSLVFRVIASASNARSKLGLGPLGDQGLFVRREIFEACGGFRTDRLLEDLDFVHRARAFGRMEILDRPLRTSIRRWRLRGVARTALQNGLYLARHLLGRGRRHRETYQQYRVDSHDPAHGKSDRPSLI